MLKNMMLYRVIDPDHVALLNDAEALNEALQERPIARPTGSQWNKIGFSRPSSLTESFVWSSPNATLFTVYVLERMLTGATIREHLNERIRKVEDREQRKCYRKEVAQMKDEVVAELLPKAFIKQSATNVIMTGNLMIVGASSAKKAEDCLSTLRDAMGSLAVRPIDYKIPADSWLRDMMQVGSRGLFKVSESAKIVNTSKDIVQFKGVDLLGEEPQNYLGMGFHPGELSVVFDEGMHLRITDKLIFKQIKFTDTVLDPVGRDADGDPAAHLDGSLILFVDWVRRMVDDIDAEIGEEVAAFKAPAKLSGADLIEAAESFVVSQGRCSVGLLCRTFKTSPDRARVVIEHLIDRGCIGEADERGVHPTLTVDGYTPPENEVIVKALNDIMAPIKDGGTMSIEIGGPELDEFGDPIEPEPEGDDL